MTKQQTNIIKGVAILMMIFYHLFNRVGAEYHGLCHPLLYIGERPLVNIIANACHPVAFFLILSGYGLSYVWENKGNNLRQQGRRILKLYISYWIVMAIFVGMGCFINPAQYPRDFWSIIGNFILGALLYRYAARKKIQRLRAWQASALLVLLVGLEMLSPTQADDSFYAFFVILLILQFPYQNRMWGAFLANLGRHSMPMWMCHTFLSIYLFPNFIYGFRYPLLIFVVLTALSYAISIVVLKSSAVLENLFKLHCNHNHIINILFL